MRYPLSVVLLLITVPVFSQKKIKTVELTDTISAVTVDRPGDLYLVTSSSQVQRFDKTGRVQQVYRKGPTLTLFEPRDGSRLFAFYREQAQYDILNSSFEVVSSQKLDSSFAVDPWLACTSGDIGVWVLDGIDWSLKRTDTRTGAVTVDVAEPQLNGKAKTDLTVLREYQNFVFVLDRKEGLHIFSSMGKYLRTLKAPGLKSFNFIGEELYYLQGNKLLFFDLFTTDRREWTLPGPADAAILTDESLFLIRNNTIGFFEYKP